MCYTIDFIVSCMLKLERMHSIKMKEMKDMTKKDAQRIDALGKKIKGLPEAIQNAICWMIAKKLSVFLKWQAKKMTFWHGH